MFVTADPSFVGHSGFDLNDLSIAEDIWLPLVVSPGSMHTDSDTSGISKIAESVIIPLADKSISVYCLSTYRTDYVLVSGRSNCSQQQVGNRSSCAYQLNRLCLYYVHIFIFYFVFKMWQSGKSFVLSVRLMHV